MSALGEYLSMGGYARFIWPAYGVTLLVLVALILDTLARVRRRRAELARLESGSATGAARAGARADDA